MNVSTRVLMASGVVAAAFLVACGGDGKKGTGTDASIPMSPPTTCDSPTAAVDVSVPTAVLGGGNAAGCSEAALRAAETDRIDAYGATLEEFSVLSTHLAFNRMAVATRMDGFQENYVVIVRQDSGWAELADLRGRDMLVLQNPRMSMAFVWLDTALLEKGLGPTAAFFGHIEEQNKPSRVALPVFFRKAAACLMTLKSFTAMQELNPQLGKQLRVLAQSPDLISSIFAFRTDFHPSYRERLFQEMHLLSESPAGQQILTLLQAQRIDEQPFSCLESSLALLARHRQLSAGAPAPQPGDSALPPIPVVQGKN